MGPWRAMLGRELLESSRRARTWTLRWVSAAAAMVALALAMPGAGGTGRPIFMAVGVLTGMWALFVGCHKTADSLGRERREGTLGLLFLTDMKGRDVVLGKLGGAGLELFFQLAAVVPVLVVPVLLGGVSAGHVGWLLAGLAGALLLSLSAGLLASLSAQDPRQATVVAVSWLLGLLLVPVALFFLLGNLENRVPEDVAKWVLLPCPAVPFTQALVPGLREWPVALGSLACQGWISWMLLRWTSRWVRTAWQEGGPRTWRIRWIEWVNRVRFGGPVERERWRRRWLAVGAWEWLSLRERWKPWLPWVLVATACGLWLANIWQLGWQDVAATSTAVMSVMFHGLFALWVAGEAGITLHEQRISGATELLLTSGMSGAEILRGQGRVLGTMLRGPVLAVTAMDLVVVAWVPWMDVEWSRVAPGWWTHLACAVLTPPTWSGMRWRTTMEVLGGRAINTAVGRALAWCVVWPGLVLFGTAVFCLMMGGHDWTRDGGVGAMVVGTVPTVLMAAWLVHGGRRWRRESEQGFRDGMMAAVRRTG